MAATRAVVVSVMATMVDSEAVIRETGTHEAATVATDLAVAVAVDMTTKTLAPVVGTVDEVVLVLVEEVVVAAAAVAATLAAGRDATATTDDSQT